MIFADYLLAALLLLFAALALWLYFRRKKSGKSCCGNCTACRNTPACKHEKKQ